MWGLLQRFLGGGFPRDPCPPFPQRADRLGGIRWKPPSPPPFAASLKQTLDKKKRLDFFARLCYIL